MPTPTANTKVIQVQVPNELVGKLDEVTARTHVPRSVIIRVAIENIVKDIYDGKVTLGINFAGQSSPSANAGNQPTFSVVAPPPPVAK